MYYETDAPTVIDNGRNNGGDGFGFGSGWGGIIALIAVAAIFGGWGGGFGGWGGGGNAATQGALTREQACIDNNFQNLMRETAGISDAVGLGFANLNSTICNQQYDTANMINNLGMNVMQGFNAANVTALQGFNGVQSQLASCCCDLSRQIERLGCEAASNTNAIIQSNNAGFRSILDYLCQEKISALQTENAVLTGQISQAAQTNAIISALSPKTPIPAYPVFPTTSFAYPTGVSFGINGLNGYGNNGCGCSCSCNG